MRLIDADDRIEFIKNAYCPGCDNYNGVRCRTCSINETIEAIDDAPTADQWHYPSKGEYPPSGEEVLCWYEPKIKVVAQYYASDDIWFCDAILSGRTPPYAWQYIESPKEEA